jgi:hypothetical protein
MADFLITAVSARYTGTDQGDTFRNGTGNLRAITVAGLSGDDLMSLGSAVTTGTGAGGQGLGFSLGSANIDLGAGDDTYTFSGQAGSGFARSDSNLYQFGSGSDFALINGLASASATTVRGGSGSDQLGFVRGTNANTAFNVLLNGNAGDDSITATWSTTGGEVKNFLIEGGQGNDSVSAVFSQVSSYALAGTGTNASGVRVQGNKGNDRLDVDVIGVTSTDVVVNGNSGADTITFTSTIALSNSQVLGGRDNDFIDAALGLGVTAQNLIVGGGLGNDTANLTLASNNNISGVALQGNSGNDVLSLNVAATANIVTAFQDNGVFGGTGTDIININLVTGADFDATGATAFVADLGVEGSGGTINVGLENGAALQGTGVFFRGSTAADTINISSDGTISGAIISGNLGADSITYSASNTASQLRNVQFLGGSGADAIKLLGFTAGIQGFAASGDGSRVDGGSGADVLGVVLSGQGTQMTGNTIQGGLGNDTITATLAVGARLTDPGNGTAGNTQIFAGGSGADSISFTLATGASTNTNVNGNSGADVFNATVASGGNLIGITVAGDDGNDTISVVYSAFTGGNAFEGGSAGFFAGDAGTDSITLIAKFRATAGAAAVGNAVGGAGDDVLTLGAEINFTGALGTAGIRGSYNGGAGTDSLIFSGNNAISGAAASFGGRGTEGSAGFIFASGDSQADGFDTIFISNNEVTGGQANLQGTLGSAGFLFTGYNSINAGAFNMVIATAATTFTAGGNVISTTAGNAIFRSEAGATNRLGIAAGGLVGGFTAGSQRGTAGRAAGNGFFVNSGGSTIGNIFSAVDSLTQGRGKASVFNVLNGSGGTVDGYLFVQGGVLTDIIVKLNGNGVAAGNAFTREEGYFSAGAANALASAVAVSNSGGQLFFGGNVGVG